MRPPHIHRAVWSEFGEMSTTDLYAMLKLRCEVFVVEQACAYPDIDGRDPEASHLLAWLDADAPLAGCLRVFAPGPGEPQARIGRVATAREARGRGLGRWMMVEALAEVERRFPGAATRIGAQVAMEGFYRSLGFERVSPDYDEDGIVHCVMRHDVLPDAFRTPVVLRRG